MGRIAKMTDSLEEPWVRLRSIDEAVDFVLAGRKVCVFEENYPLSGGFIDYFAKGGDLSVVERYLLVPINAFCEELRSLITSNHPRIKTRLLDQAVEVSGNFNLVPLPLRKFYQASSQKDFNEE